MNVQHAPEQSNPPDAGKACPGTPRPLRVALHCRALATRFGGMERTVVSLGNHLVGIGWEVCFFYNANKGARLVYPAAPEILHRPIEGGPRLPERFAEAAADFVPDVNVWFYADASAIPFVVALSGTGAPLVLHEGTNPERLVTTNWAERLGMSVARAAAEREALSALATRVRVTLPSYVESFGPAMRPHVVGFPNAFPEAAPDTEALRHAAPRKRFIHIGGLKLNKNLMPALEAFALIAEDVPGWDFAIFSDEPPRANVRPDVEAFIRQSGLAERILLYPPTQEIFREYARSHAHVISSLSEGLPNCVAEAMRHALPSIGYDVCPGTNELIVHGENGLLANAGDPVRSLADRMLALARDDEGRERLGRRALADSAMFDGDAVMEHWTALLREAASYGRDGTRLRRERLGFDPAALRRSERVQRSAFLAAPAPEPAEERDHALSVLLPPGASGDDLRRLAGVLERSGERAEVLLPQDGAAALPPELALPDRCTVRRAVFSEDPRLGAAGEYLLCLPADSRGETALEAAVDFALRVRRQGADVGLTLPEGAGVPEGLTTLGRAGPALFAAAPAVSVWKLSHLSAFAIQPEPHASLPAALIATATAAAILVEARPPEGEPAAWCRLRAPRRAEAVDLRATLARRFEDASVEALCPVADAVLARAWLLPLLADVFDRSRIDHDAADGLRSLAASLRHGAPLLARDSLPEAVAVMTAGMGYYPWVLPALRHQPLPRQILHAIEKALPGTTLSTGRGALTRRWPRVA